MLETLTIARGEETQGTREDGPVLVAFSPSSESTRDVASAIAEELRDGGTDAVAMPVDEVEDLDEYSAVVVGGAMVVGRHREAGKFIRRFAAELAEMPVAVFFTVESVTDTGAPVPGDLDLVIDPGITDAPVKSGALSFRDRMTSVAYYLKPFRKLWKELAPRSVAFFGGKLDYRELPFVHLIFVLLVVGAKPGDYRDWKLIRRWSREIRSLLDLE